VTTPPVMSSARWASNDARFGPRQVTLIDTRRDKALIRYADGRTAWILAHRVHDMSDARSRRVASVDAAPGKCAAVLGTRWTVAAERKEPTA
jgi:hypothetical protein